LRREWEILTSEYVVESPWYRLRRDVCRLPDGTIVDPYYVREHDGFAVVFAITSGGDVVLTRQYKHGCSAVVLELPAGALDAGESPQTCAARELEEETGYRARSLERIAELYADPTNSSGTLHLFLARDAAPDGVRSPDPTEDIEIVLMPLDRLLDQVRGGVFRSQSQVAAIYASLDRLGRIGPV
jgi:ADP-ribose pyrophosphatase